MSYLPNVTRTLLVSFLAIITIPWLLDAAEAQLNVTGQWTTLPYLMPINPIHLGLLRTGKVLVVAGSESEPAKHDAGISKAAVWDVTTGTFSMQTPPFDVFCNGMAFLPDGRALIVGGTETYDPFHGDARAVVFDPATERFNQVESMLHGRWYATTTALDDGRILAFSGSNELGAINRAIELYKIGTGWGPEIRTWPGADPPLYPWMHLLPNGKVFYSGYGIGTAMFDPATSTWTSLGTHQWNDSTCSTSSTGCTRPYGTSVLLPLLPEKGYASRVIVMGGHNPATSTAEIIDLSQPTPAWRKLPPMSLPRIEMSGTLLPNGKVLASGGSAVDNTVSTASKAADLFDPATETWSPAGTAAYHRLYHSTALLLPDATVVTAGSNPTRGSYEPHIEIWTPPYLFNADGSRATRPTISSAPTRVGYAGNFTLQSPDAATIGSVVLIRNGSPTHAFDMEQRLIGLTYSVSGTTLTVQAPPNARIAPPGHYMVFILNRQGVPSVARFMQLSTVPSNRPPDGTITQPAGNVTIQAGQTVSFAGSGSDLDGAISRYAWTFPGGTPVSVLNNPTPGAVTFSEPGTYVAALTVVDSVGENDPSPPTRTVTVTPTVVNQPPTANPGGPYSGPTGQAIQLNGSASSDPDGTITTYAWSFGDGTSGNGAMATHAYAVAGTYTVRLTVTDNAGATGTASTMATVTTAVNKPPIARPGGPYSGPPAQSIQLDGSTSSDPDGSITKYVWSFGDGTPTQTCNAGAPAPPCGGSGAPGKVTHAWAGAGSYTVSLTVTDNAGATGTATTAATVTAVVSTPAAPTGLGATSAKRQVTLKWIDNAGNESGFKIERSANGVTFTEIATVGPNVVTYVQGGVKKTTWYRVRAYNSAGNSAYSNTVRVQ